MPRIAFRLVAMTFLFTCNKGSGGAPMTGATGGAASTGAGGVNAGASGGATTGVGGAGGSGAMGPGGVGSGGVAGEFGSTGGATGGGGAGEVRDAAADDPSDSGEPNPIVASFAAQALGFAMDYKTWGRVDDELRWAPFLCRIPLPGIARPSESNDPATHGQKLYSVFAKNHDAYPSGAQTDQVVVKESWIPELVTGPEASFDPAGQKYAADAGDHFYGYAKGDGGVYRAATFAGLYLMFRLPESTPDTDEGWVYATITAAGEITAAGRVASCMTCHETATHERLFGVPLSPSLP